MCVTTPSRSILRTQPARAHSLPDGASGRRWRRPEVCSKCARMPRSRREVQRTRWSVTASERSVRNGVGDHPHAGSAESLAHPRGAHLSDHAEQLCDDLGNHCRWRLWDRRRHPACDPRRDWPFCAPRRDRQGRGASGDAWSRRHRRPRQNWHADLRTPTATKSYTPTPCTMRNLHAPSPSPCT